VRFINRQQNSGTRFLLDLMLEEAKISPSRIQGYESAEFTHAAVAAFVASGMADAGFGVQAAASQFNLEFIPLAHENYCLAGAKSTWDSPPVKLLYEKICGDDFPKLIASLPGYDATGAGSWLSLKDFSIT
jgi:molybdate-binding protein